MMEMILFNEVRDNSIAMLLNNKETNDAAESDEVTFVSTVSHSDERIACIQENDEINHGISSESSSQACKAFSNVVTYHDYQKHADLSILNLIVKAMSVMTMKIGREYQWLEEANTMISLEDGSRKIRQFLLLCL